MAAKSTPKQVSKQVIFDYARTCPFGFFNSFAIESVAGQRLIEFGLLRNRTLLFSFRCIVLEDTLSRLKNSMLEFLGTVSDEGRPLTECDPMPMTRDESSVQACNFMSASRFGSVGEVRFGQFSFGMLLEEAQKTSGRASLLAHPLVVLNCELPMLRLFIMKLFRDIQSA